jgi:inosose dehydratase
LVTNPSPIRWGAPQDKNDDQLKVQAAALDHLGARVRALGLVLAYHNHDMELRNAAREFHHMLLGTDPRNLSFCLDAHWVYRGSGNSSVALFDVLRLYGPRVVELHLRQSAGGIWTETLCDGDIDYRALAKYLAGIGVRPHLVLEQAPEKGTPNTMDAVESHRRSRAYAAAVFAEPAS